jgi:glycine cleavage system regulatory protein
MPCKIPPPRPSSEIVVKVPAEDRQRIAARIVALLKRAGVSAEVVSPEDDDAGNDEPKR